MNYPIKLDKIIGEVIVTTHMEGQGIYVGTQGGKLVCESIPDFSKGNYVVVEVTNLNPDQLEIHMGFYNNAECTGNPVLNCIIGTIPSNRVTAYFDLKYLKNQEIFLPRTPGILKTVVQGTTIPKEEIRGITFTLLDFYNPQSFILHNVYLSDKKPDCTIKNPVKLVDSLGQISIKDWPGKTYSEEEMIIRMKELFNDVQEEYPSEYLFSKYGGYMNKKFEATGYFSVQKDNERWWLVDPEGYAFFSVGFDCYGTNCSDRITDIENLYERLPDENSVFSPAYSNGGGNVFNEGKFFDFYIANLIKVFGEKWWNAWAKISKSQMYKWGINTIGNWSQENFIKWAKMPYVYPLADFPTTENKIFRDFPDVFSEEYRNSSQEYAKQLERFKGDKLLIGYFMRNEPIWAFADELNLAHEMFRDLTMFKTKEKLIGWMISLYKGDIGFLNQAWDVKLNSFNDIASMKFNDFNHNPQKDLNEFSKLMVYEYIKIPAEALKMEDPHHLNLGMRYAWISSDIVFEGCDYFDVFSLNCYKTKPNSEEISYITKKTGKPCMIGEFHFGAPDRGPIAAGLRSVRTQQDRAKAYRYYVEQSASMKELVGVHYFTQNDEAALGRGDGEAWQIGAVDVCQQVYTEFVEGVKKAHENMYLVASGEKEPYNEIADEIPRMAY